jgi:PPOX class probable F420-dependent enzyme
MSGYPQKPPLTREEIEEFLEKPLVAILGTHNEDGTIHLAPVWFLYEDGEIIIGTQEISRKIRNIKRDSNVTVLVSKHETPYKAVMMYGKAEIDKDDVVEKRVAIFENYTSREKAEKWVKDYIEKHKPLIVRIKPKRFVSFDYSK